MTFRVEINAKKRDMRRHIKATYAAFSLLVAVCVFWLIFFVITQQWFELKLVLIGLCPYPIFFGLMWRGWIILARSLWLTWLTSFMLFLTFVPTEGTNASIHFYSTLAFPFLIFSWTYERRAMTISLLCIGSAAMTGMAAEALGLRDILDIPLPAALIEREHLYPELRSFFNQVSVAAILLIELMYFGYLTEAANIKAAKALKDAEQSARAKGEFLANMSHEIRTPMNGLIGMMDVLDNQELNKRQSTSVATMRSSAMSLLRIINDILDASKIEAGKLDIDLHHTEFLPLVESVAQMLRPLADDAGVTLRLYLDPELPAFITADAGRIRQILLNLSSNAIKFSSRRITNRQGDVFLRIEKCEGHMVKFRVIDNGIGMDDKMLNVLFQPFSQADSAANRRTTGTGLGLSITRNLTDLMGGKIEVSSTLGEGTDITVCLPLPAAKGQNSLPDISSAQLICFSFDDINIYDGLKDMLNRSGAETHYVTSQKDLSALPLKAQPVILLPSDDQVRTARLEAEILAAYPDCRVIRFASQRESHFGRTGPRTAKVQIKPMLLSDMMHAIAELSGILETSPTRHDGTMPDGAAQNHSDKPRILVIEDNEINRMVLGQQLDILNYPHEMAIDGAEGLALWRSGRFKIILTDCHMPVMDGFELTHEIRKAEARTQTPPTKIIAVTANALDGEAERCLNAGMDDYLSKPLELETLRQKLDELQAP